MGVGSRAEQRERTARRIRLAAREVLLERGYDAATITEVGKRAGVAHGTVLMHFGSKSELATEAFTDQISELVESAWAQHRMSDDPVDDFAGMVKVLYAWYHRNADVARHLLRESIFSTGSAGDRYTTEVLSTIERWSDLIVRHQAAGRIDRRYSATDLAQSVFATYTFVLLQGVRGRYDSVDDQVAGFRELVSVLFITT